MTLTSAPWCTSTAVTLSESVSAAEGQTIDNASESFTPYMGRTGSNPYLLVSINGTPQNWAFESFNPTNCWNNPSATCRSSMIIDPVPYAEPGAQFDPNSNLLGTQANPFVINANLLLADATHALQWATRSVNGVQQWGTFSIAISRGGITQYEYSQKY
ncbi:MAG: hypothetical protein WBY94_03735 [Polyangiaceae bacterium]